MESFARREDVLLGQFQSSPKSGNRDESDMDFSDVFGGPPRRFSMQEMRVRYSFSESTMESSSEQEGKRWSGFDEKPVFGEENVNRRSYQNDDFFDDIFRGDDSKSAYGSPRIGRDVFGPNPSSRVLSPARPLPPKAEPFSTSVPAQFSLPAKLTKGMDFPAFASANRGLYKSKDGTANGANYTLTSSVSLSRFASQTTELMEETRKDQSVYHQRSLSHQVSLSSEELIYETRSDEKDKDSKLTNDSENADASADASTDDSFQFHFSIYKWAGKGVPSLIPLMASNKLRSRFKSKMERCSSSNARIHCDSIYRDSPDVEEQIIAVNTETVSSEEKDGKQDGTSKENKIKSENEVNEPHPEVPELENVKTERHAKPNGEAISNRKTEEEARSKHELDISEKPKKEVYMKKKQAHMPEQKPLGALFKEERQGKGYATDGEENKFKVSTAAKEDVKAINRAKKTNSKGTNLNKAEAAKASLQGSATKSGVALGKSAVKGKVMEFVKIFNQEPSVKPKSNSEIPSKSSRWKGIDVNETQNENENSKETKIPEKVYASNTEKMPDASCREDDKPEADKVKQDTHSRSSVHKTSRQFSNEKNPPIFSDSLPNNREAKVENRRESSQGEFLIEEQPQILDKDLQTQGDSVDIKGLDAKIKQWSNGRKGNIRSLLSTLQLVLWAESGWKPVPLVDIIEGNAVKRAYQRALLCLHPDKLQQKGAASDQKYVAEKVFDILQEAWDHFNALGFI